MKQNRRTNGHGDYDLMTTYEKAKKAEAHKAEAHKKGKRKRSGSENKPVHTTRAATAQEIRQDLKQTERNRLRAMKRSTVGKPKKIRKKI